MPLIDERGRVFGRVNLVDGLFIATLVAILPLAYASVLLFRPSRPVITSVTHAVVNNDDRRIVRGTLLSAKLKVHGQGFTPMLRASVGNTPVLGFVFEHPNSADVLVGPLPPGAHDLVLYDGVQEVARAAGAVVIEPPAGRVLRAIGRAIGPAETINRQFTPGTRFPNGTYAYEVLAAGTTTPAADRVRLAGRDTDVPRAGLVERDVALALRCDPAVGDEVCSVGGVPLRGDAAIPVDLPAPDGSVRFVVQEIFPTAPPARASVRVRFDAGTPAIRTGDKDALLDERAAVARGAGALVTFDLGADASRDGWRYRGRLLRAGAPFTFSTDTYTASGIIDSVVVEGGASR